MTTSAASTGRTEAFHQFLKMTQPISHSSLPPASILKAGQVYEFEFLFVVPERTLPRICRHAVDNHSVHEAHTLLPPSLGNQDKIGKKSTPDDFAPDMANIRYAVVANVVEPSAYGQKPQTTSQSKPIRIVPAADELPPLTYEDPETEYVMRAEKTIKKGLLKGKTGTLIMEAAQPRSFRLSPPNTENLGPVSTMATVMLRFDPIDAASQPPRLGSLSSKLKINTYFASAARKNFPSKDLIRWDLHQGLHFECISLPSRCVAGVDWTYHTAAESESLFRRDSGLSVGSAMEAKHPIPHASAQYKGTGFYTAQILAPLGLPTNKTFVPTFHSCLSSRVYGINLHLGIQSTGIGSGVELKLPIQISSETASAAPSPRIVSVTADEQAYEAIEGEDFFTSRTLSPVYEPLAQNTLLDTASSGTPYPDLPPEYEALPARTAPPRVPVY